MDISETERKTPPFFAERQDIREGKDKGNPDVMERKNTAFFGGGFPASSWRGQGI